MKHPESHKEERKGGDERTRRETRPNASDKAEFPGSAFQCGAEML
jgi:hypothetical protein